MLNRLEGSAVETDGPALIEAPFSLRPSPRIMSNLRGMGLGDGLADHLYHARAFSGWPAQGAEEGLVSPSRRDRWVLTWRPAGDTMGAGASSGTRLHA